MNIVGVDALVFAVEDLATVTKYLTDFGLKIEGKKNGGLLFAAADGTGVVVADQNGAGLPPPLSPTNKLRKIVYGVADRESLEQIAAELSKDREVRQLDDDSLESVDDMGITLGFQLTARRVIDMPAERINAPGAPMQRDINCIGVVENAPVQPRTLSHFALFVPDVAKAEAFYVERLAFRCSDRLGGGPFLRSKGTFEHHIQFLIQTPPQLKGAEHLAFHVSGPSEVIYAGNRFRELGYKSFWGPGRHNFGSNWFWYFESPLGCRCEYDADMDKHDDNWVPREKPLHADNAQAYLLEVRKNWAPFDGPPPV